MDASLFEDVVVYECWFQPEFNTKNIAEKLYDEIEVDKHTILSIISQGCMLWVICDKNISATILEWLERNDYWNTTYTPYGKLLFY